MTRQLIVVLLESVSQEELRAAVDVYAGEEAVVTIVAPSHPGALAWLATDEAPANAAASVRALEAEWLLEGIAEVAGEVTAADPVVGVVDVLEHFPAEEIVLVGSGVVDAELVAALRSLGLPLRLSGVLEGPVTASSRLRAWLRGLSSGRDPATPFVALIAANLGLVAIAIAGSLLVGLVVWLAGAL